MEKLDSLTLSSGASFHRGKSKQDYATPEDFRLAVAKRFGHPAFDLAASFENRFSLRDFYSEGDNSLIQHWHKLKGILWLNPPFGNIEPWAKKCREESLKGAHILFLVPASVGSEWFRLHVHDKATVYFLNPRLSFDGKNSFPKDCLLGAYGMVGVGYDVWRWK